MPLYSAQRQEERIRKRKRLELRSASSPKSTASLDRNPALQSTHVSLSDVAIEVLHRFVNPTPKSNLKYLPLDENDQIRLLCILPGKFNDSIVCGLSSVSLDTPHEYSALSYCWGTDPARDAIQIIQRLQIPGQRRSLKAIRHGTLYVKPTLYAALQHLRDPEENRVFWIDAICINQHDLQERSKQVSKMPQIYSMANHVDIWLGNGDTESDRAMEFLGLVLNPYSLDSLLSDHSTVTQWYALFKLIQRPWFSRRWIIQEIMLAKRATLHCGNYVQDWSNFLGVLEMIKRYLDDLKKMFARSLKAGEDTEILNDIQTFGAYSLVRATSTLLKKSNDGRVLERLRTLEELLLDLPAFQCGNLRDFIYAILSLARDIPSLQKSSSDSNSLTSLTPNFDVSASLKASEHISSFDVDYAKYTAEVFADVVKFYTLTTGNLDILCRHWAPPRHVFPTNDPPLPSWILSIFPSSTKHLGSRYRNWGLKLPNSLVGPPGRRDYNACGKYQTALPRFQITTSEQIFRELWERDTVTKSCSKQLVSVLDRSFTGFIFVQGLRLDTIAEIGPRAAEGVVPYEWLDMIDIQQDGIQEAFWRTLVANRSEDNKTTPAWYGMSWNYCMVNSHHGDINLTAMAQSDSPKMVEPFVKRAYSVIWNRKLFVTKAGDKITSIGLAPIGARAGDKTCIFYGCSVPIILREHIDSQGLHFEFIGESYVHDSMEGEAFNHLSREDLEAATEEFKLK